LIVSRIVAINFFDSHVVEFERASNRGHACLIKEHVFVSSKVSALECLGCVTSLIENEERCDIKLCFIHRDHSFSKTDDVLSNSGLVG
jgi:hypothetical protein